MDSVPGKIILAEKARALNDTEGVRLLAKQLLSNNDVGFFSRRWVTYLLLAADLLDGNLLSAKRVLKNLDPEGDKPDFYPEHIRLALLAGDEEKAAFYYQKLLSMGDFYLFEFMYAREVKYYQLIRLQFLINYRSDQLSMKSNKWEGQEKSTYEEFENFVGKSPKIEFVKDEIHKFANENIHVLITGETGSGKEEVARLLHDLSDRAEEPFIPVNCAGITSSLMEAEFFGYKKGAYTGAVSDQKGLFESAGKGTIFLDEIGSMPMSLQSTLLRVLETMKVRPVGSSKMVDINARIIAATNVRLEELMEKGDFRKDLFYRLNRLPINLPPLRERKDDVEVLLKHFISKYFNEKEIEIQQDVLQIFKEYEWPGNVRQLKNEIERLSVIAGNAKFITRDMLSFFKHENSKPKIKDDPVLIFSSSGKPSILTNRPLSNYSSYQNKRLASLIDLFKVKKRLTRTMVVRELNCAPNTAAKDLLELEKQNIIKKIIPTDSPRSSYYEMLD